MQWFEDEEFWRELYPYMFPPERFAIAPAQAEQVLALANLPAGSVLDLCCGPGRHSVEFARRRFAVTGVDRTPFLLDRAREAAVEAGVSVEWVTEDMRRFRRPSTFNLACSLFTSFGYFETEDEDLQVLRNVHESLKPGGTLVVDVAGKEKLARFWKDTFCTEYGDGCVLIQRPRVFADWSKIHNEWTLLRKDGTFRSFYFEHWLYSGRELKDRLLACGFREVRLYGDLSGKPFDLNAERLVAVARK